MVLGVGNNKSFIAKDTKVFLCRTLLSTWCKTFLGKKMLLFLRGFHTTWAKTTNQLTQFHWWRSCISLARKGRTRL